MFQENVTINMNKKLINKTGFLFLFQIVALNNASLFGEHFMDANNGNF